MEKLVQLVSGLAIASLICFSRPADFSSIGLNGDNHADCHAECQQASFVFAECDHRTKDDQCVTAGTCVKNVITYAKCPEGAPSEQGKCVTEYSGTAVEGTQELISLAWQGPLQCTQWQGGMVSIPNFPNGPCVFVSASTGRCFLSQGCEGTVIQNGQDRTGAYLCVPPSLQ